MIPGPGGTHGHMHHALDGLPPHAAVEAVATEFPAWHLHETGLGVWADTDAAPVPGPPVTVRAADAERLWQEIAAYEWRWYLAGWSLVFGTEAARPLNVPAAAPSDRQWSGNSDPGETPDGPAAGTLLPGGTEVAS